MRLIDADALKAEVNKKNVIGRFNTLLLIDNAPTVEPERPQGEWISKEEALKIMCEKCPVYNCVSGCNSYRSIEKMSSVQSQRPTVAVNCKDCDGYEAGYSAGLKDAERPQGEWIDHWSEDLQKMGFRQCSKCKAGCQLYEHGTRKSDLPWIDGQQYTLKRICNFCPNCGAKMKGGTE